MLPPGVYTVTVTCFGHKSKSTSVTVIPHELSELKFILNEGTGFETSTQEAPHKITALPINLSMVKPGIVGMYFA